MSKQDFSRQIKIQELIMVPKQDYQRKFLLVQNQGLNPGIQSRDPGIGIFQSRNPGIGKEVRDCNPYCLAGFLVELLKSNNAIRQQRCLFLEL